MLAAAGGGKKAYSYGYVFNGFAAELTEAQADKIRSMPGVLSVEKDVIVDVDTSSTPSFLGLDAPGGLWDQLGGPGSAGENIIIGVIDSGIWPESLSFSDRTGANGNASKDGKLAYQQIAGWHGKCVPGEAFNASLCNQKLIGAQHFNAGWGGDAGIDAERPWEFTSVRDYNGHGTHTSSTAGGNSNVDVTGPGEAARLGERHGAARADRDVQGAVVHAGHGNGERVRRRPRRGDRPGGGRRRRRHQLLDQRHADQLRGRRSKSRSCSPPTRVCSSRLRGQQRPDDGHGRAPEPLDHHGGRGHAQSRRRRVR